MSTFRHMVRLVLRAFVAEVLRRPGGARAVKQAEWDRLQAEKRSLERRHLGLSADQDEAFRKGLDEL